ncbi:MAG: cofactor-independent phosphoglycerate mutase [Spirochaetales bacterium]|nr:cofactor-independent phosphoglycerate mutase [Spirochaetales bacterium]
MKYIIIIIDGAADLPLPVLQNKTPLEAAAIPTLDWMAAHGSIGTVNMVPEGLPCGSDVAIMSLLGYDPKAYYTGRAPIEAVAQDLELGEQQWVFRCNLVTIENNIMKDHSAHNISTKKSHELINLLNTRCPFPDIRFFPGVSYRNLMTVNYELSVTTTPPHDILEKDITEFLPKGRDAANLHEVINWSNKILGSENNHHATHIWLWGQGKKPTLPRFYDRFQLKGAVITAVDLVRGLAKLIGWDTLPVAGATGDFHTDYRGKGQRAIQGLADYDLICVHIEATDEAGHKGDALEKKQALERIDADIVKPIMDHVLKHEREWSVLVLPDHPTPCTIRTHTADPVPFVLLSNSYGEKNQELAFSEKNAGLSRLTIASGHKLMQDFIRGSIKSH